MIAVNQEKLLAYRVTAYTDSSEERVPDGCRLSVISWKKGKNADGTERLAKSAVCVAIPLVMIELPNTVLKEVFEDAFCNLQDAAVRTWIENLLSETPNAVLIGKMLPADTVTVDGVVSYWKGSQTKKRLTKEMLTSWFDAKLAAPLVETMVVKGTAENVIEKAVNQYKTLISGMASPHFRAPTNTLESLCRALKLVESWETDRIASGLVSKIEDRLKPDELLLIEAI